MLSERRFCVNEGSERPDWRATRSGAVPCQRAASSPGRRDLPNHKTTVSFGSADSDVFTYDANTGRLAQYKFNVNAQSVVGNLTWNANGTLQTLGITDPLNSANSQTCTYGYDDLVRLSSAGCGATWSQTFSFDPFGNISKSGTFQPTYNTMNRYQTLPGFTPSYDASGNLLNDSFHQYTWDQNFGNVLSIDTVGLTYDALERRVAQPSSDPCTTQPGGAPFVALFATVGNGSQLAFVVIPVASALAVIFSTDGLDSFTRTGPGSPKT